MKKFYFFILVLTFISFSLDAQVTYTGKPTYKIDVKRAGIPIGSIHIELFPNLAYHHVRNFDSLVSVQFYDSTAFHRVIPGFMIQGGDPNSRSGPTSTWGYGQAGQPTVNAEFSTARHVRGILSAARSSNINSATSQFFICVATAANLNGNYSVYGRVTSGMNIVDTIVLAPRNSNDLPNLKHEMFITATGSNDSVPDTPILNTPPNGAINTPTSSSLLLKWNAIPGAVEYEIEVSDDPFFINIFKSAKAGTTLYYLTNTLDEDMQYYWHVRANNGGHYSDWSSDFMFSTAKDAVGVQELKNSDGSVQVYPNPSYGTFNFKGIQVSDHMRVYSMDGKLIRDDRVMNTNYILNLETEKKGIYFYYIKHSSGNTNKGKLIVK